MRKTDTGQYARRRNFGGRSDGSFAVSPRYFYEPSRYFYVTGATIRRERLCRRAGVCRRGYVAGKLHFLRDDEGEGTRVFLFLCEHNAARCYREPILSPCSVQASEITRRGTYFEIMQAKPEGKQPDERERGCTKAKNSIQFYRFDRHNVSLTQGAVVVLLPVDTWS